MDGWLRLKNIPEGPPQPAVPGVLFDVVVSPYNVPEAIRAVKVRGGRFRIEFRYIDGDEPGREVALDGHVTVIEGRHSQRLLALEVDVDALGAKTVGVSFTAVDQLKTQLTSAWDRVQRMRGPSYENRDRVRWAFEARQTELLQGMAGSQ